MTMHTPPECQGQTVEVSYGWDGANFYRQVHDRSDDTTTWYRAHAASARKYADSGDEPWNEEPKITRWTPCAEPDCDDDVTGGAR